MKALIIKKHWLDKIFDDGKTWEMRSRRTNVRGKILLIESGSGMIMGEAILDGCIEDIGVTGLQYYKDKHKIEDFKLLEKWNVAWVINNAKRYKEPIPYKHSQGAVVWVNV